MNGVGARAPLWRIVRYAVYDPHGRYGVEQDDALCVSLDDAHFVRLVVVEHVADVASVAAVELRQRHAGH